MNDFFLKRGISFSRFLFYLLFHYNVLAMERVILKRLNVFIFSFKVYFFHLHVYSMRPIGIVKEWFYGCEWKIRAVPSKNTHTSLDALHRTDDCYGLKYRPISILYHQVHVSILYYLSLYLFRRIVIEDLTKVINIWSANLRI